MRKATRSVSVLAIAPLTACTPSAVDLDAARAELLRTDREWARTASTTRDVDVILAFWTDDARVYPPQHAVLEGKEAIRHYVKSSMEIPGFSITWEPVGGEVGPSGGLGYTWGTNEITYNDADANLVTSRGRYVTVWRKGEDGTWRCSIDIWNAGP